MDRRTAREIASFFLMFHRVNSDMVARLMKEPTHLPENPSVTGDQQTGVIARDVALISAKVPFIGPYIELLGKLSLGSRRWIIYLVLGLLLYPIVSFFAVILALRISPHFVQVSARNLILPSIGVGDATQLEINKNNRLIDTEIPLSFSQDGRDVYYQVVSTTQNVQFDGIMRLFPAARQAAGCANVTLDLNRVIGTLDVISVSSSYQGHYPIRAFVDQVQRIKSIGPTEWRNFLSEAPSDVDNYPFRLSFKPDPSLKADPYFKCYEVRLWVNMTIFKPVMGDH